MKRKEYLLCIGTYTGSGSKGIYGISFRPETGEAKEAYVMAETENPSYLITDGGESRLYAVVETDSYQGKKGGGVVGYKIDNESGKLLLINEQPVHGKGPCHLTLNTAETVLLTANYNDGSISVFPISETGKIEPMSQRIRHEGCSMNEERQEGPHMHFVTYTPDTTCLYAVDLGIDQIRIYHLKEGVPCLTSDTGQVIHIEGRSGPRHLVFHPDGLYFYVVTELTSKVMVFKRHVNDTAELIQTISTLPEGMQCENLCSAVKITPDGKFLYVANRGHNSIAAYNISKNGDELSLINFTPAGGVFPRDIEIDPYGSWLFAANQESDEITAFLIQEETGVLKPVGTIANIAKPTCIKILDKISLAEE